MATQPETISNLAETLSQKPDFCLEIGLVFTERVRFELTEACTSSDFKSDAFDHSATFPNVSSLSYHDRDDFRSIFPHNRARTQIKVPILRTLDLFRYYYLLLLSYINSAGRQK